MAEKKGFLHNYCIKHNCTFNELSRLTDISYPRLREMDRGVATDMRVSTALTLYITTKEKFNDPILPWDVINLEKNPSQKNLNNVEKIKKQLTINN